jgi:hypothetical protein
MMTVSGASRDVQSKEQKNEDLQFGPLSYSASDDRDLWITAWRGIASRKRTVDRYPDIAYS